MEEYLNNRIKHAEKRIDQYKEREDILSGHGKWSMGYWEGMLMAYENALDYLEENQK